MAIYFLHKVALYFSTPAVNKRLVEWLQWQKGGLECWSVIESGTRNMKEGEKPDVYQEFGLVDSPIQRIWKNRTKLISEWYGE
jgi:hypothetical protein